MFAKGNTVFDSKEEREAFLYEEPFQKQETNQTTRKRGVGIEPSHPLPPPGFEPESSGRKPEMIGRTTPQGPSRGTTRSCFKRIG